MVRVNDAVSSATSCWSGATAGKVHGEISTGRKGGGGKATIGRADGMGGGKFFGGGIGGGPTNAEIGRNEGRGGSSTVFSGDVLVDLSAGRGGDVGGDEGSSGRE